MAPLRSKPPEGGSPPGPAQVRSAREMASDLDLVLIVGSVHVVGLGFAAAMLWHFMRAAPNDPGSHDDDGGGGGGNLPVRDPAPRRPHGGGLPPPDAGPPRRRLREPGRTAARAPPRGPRAPPTPPPSGPRPPASS